MTIVRHELKRGRITFLIWCAVIVSLLATCIFIFPEMKGEMEEAGDIFASMGSFTAAFGMDKLNFGTLVGYYAIECGNVLGLGGAFYASICAIAALCKEEKDGTAEFLLTCPVSRTRIVTEKLVAVIIQITALNLIVFALSVGSTAAIGESVPWKEMTLLHVAYYVMQLELGLVCFGISAFLRKGSVGIGIGVAATAYFLNIIANLTRSAEFLKYVTPFGYCDGATIVNDGKLDGVMMATGAAVGAACAVAAFIRYRKKDIH